MTPSNNEFELAPLGLETRGTLVILVVAILLTCVGLLTGTAAVFAATTRGRADAADHSRAC
jgi:hypothetical protein